MDQDAGTGPGERRGPSGVTLGDVAQRARVSLATASRALNGSSRVVNPALAARVSQAAADLRYVSHALAQALARSTTSTVGLVVHDVDDPYFAAIAAGAMRVAAAQGLLTMLASTFRHAGAEAEYVRRFRAQRVRGLLLAGSARPGQSAELDQALAEFAEGGGRVAVTSDHALPCDAVHPGNALGGAQVAKALHDPGHGQVAVIAGPRGLKKVHDRVSGFTHAWAGLGLPPPVWWILTSPGQAGTPPPGTFSTGTRRRPRSSRSTT